MLPLSEEFCRSAALAARAQTTPIARTSRLRETMVVSGQDARFARPLAGCEAVTTLMSVRLSPSSAG
ncbi:hypothetical protein K523DRAFT_398614 [Schizophyllum commune Tattone D]|nr:hypothetical protein K523DRAFT_398614 [Schizophyllum commune Tattone D]